MGIVTLIQLYDYDLHITQIVYVLIKRYENTIYAQSYARRKTHENLRIIFRLE